jgi:hypothetical protein
MTRVALEEPNTTPDLLEKTDLRTRTNEQVEDIDAQTSG